MSIPAEGDFADVVVVIESAFTTTDYLPVKILVEPVYIIAKDE